MFCNISPDRQLDIGHQACAMPPKGVFYMVGDLPSNREVFPTRSDLTGPQKPWPFQGKISSKTKTLLAKRNPDYFSSLERKKEVAFYFLSEFVFFHMVDNLSRLERKQLVS
jgi:hypothetical protein